MKAYATKDHAIAVNENIKVSIRYTTEPSASSRYTTRELASAECVRFNQSHVHEGSHCCAFAVDRLPEGDYGIICACHPTLRVEQRAV
ncbi:MAG TPA: hypothetical protein VGF82_24740 [Terracidiphilus sp.]